MYCVSYPSMTVFSSYGIFLTVNDVNASPSGFWCSVYIFWNAMEKAWWCLEASPLSTVTNVLWHKFVDVSKPPRSIWTLICMRFRREMRRQLGSWLEISSRRCIPYGLRNQLYFECNLPHSLQIKGSESVCCFHLGSEPSLTHLQTAGETEAAVATVTSRFFIF